jgi:hypothetical protein
VYSRRVVHLEELFGRVVGHVRIDRVDVREESLALVLLDPIGRLFEHAVRVGVLLLADEVRVVVPALIEAELVRDITVRR